MSETPAHNPDLMAAIQADPLDDIVRLAYTDWLEEQGEVERAEYIRLSIELAKSDNQARKQIIEGRLKELRGENNENHEYLLGLKKGVLGVLDALYEGTEIAGKWSENRGFLCSIATFNENFEQLLSLKEKVFPYAVVDSVSFHSMKIQNDYIAKKIYELLPTTLKYLKVSICPDNGIVKSLEDIIITLFPDNCKFSLLSLDLQGSFMTRGQMSMFFDILAKRGVLDNLEELSLGSIYDITNNCLRTVVDKWKNSLVKLGLQARQEIGEKEFEIIAELKKLHTLDLANTEFNCDCLRILKDLKLKEINIYGNYTGRDELRLVAEQFQKTLEVLGIDLDSNRLNIYEFSTILLDDFGKMPQLRELRLRIDYFELPQELPEVLEEIISVLTCNEGNSGQFPNLVSLGDDEQDILNLVSEETRQAWQAAVAKRQQKSLQR